MVSSPGILSLIDLQLNFAKRSYQERSGDADFLVAVPTARGDLVPRLFAIEARSGG